MGNIIRNIVELLLISIMIVMGISTGFLLMNDGVDNVEFVVDNQTFTTDTAMDFSSVTIDSTFIKFNDTGFYIVSSNDITITLSYLRPDMTSASDGDTVVSFSADTTDGTVWFNISGFPAGTSYIVKRDTVNFDTVTANSSGYISFSNDAWSSHTFDITQDGDSNTPPNAPTNPNPADSATDVSTSPSLSVDVSDSDGDAMDVTFYDAGDDSVIGTDSGISNGGTASVSWSGLSYSTSYSWYAIASDGVVSGDASSTWSFTTENAPNSPPNNPSNPSPGNGVTDVSIEPLLSWDGGDPDGDDVTYDVYFDTGSPPTSKQASNQSATSFDPGSLSNDVTYYWRVVAWDELGEKQTGSIWSFTTIESDDEPPVISDELVSMSSPIDSSIGWENVTCVVSDNSAVDSVYVNITKPDGTRTNVSMSEATDGSFYYNTTFSQFGRYDFFVFAIDTNSNTNSSETDTFTVFANWDVNNDGTCNNLDLVAISNQYGSSGENGWIREDIDNNGFIQVLDLSIASSHFGDSYEV